MKLTKTNVNASAETLFAVIADFRKWPLWSPHEKTDPAVRRTYSDPSQGKGAVYEWDGGNKFGVGRARITQADGPTKIVVDFDLTKPVAGHLALTFTLQQSGTVTRVDVETSGESDVVNYVMKALFNGSLINLSCAAGGSPKQVCDIFMKDFADR